MNDKFRESRLHGNDVFPFVLYEMPNDEYPLFSPFHWQEDVEILLINAGEVELTLEGVSMVLYSGDIVCINQGQLHSFHGLTSDAECEIFIFSLHHLLFAQEDHDQRKYLKPMSEGKYGFPFYFEDSITRNIILQIVDVYKRKPFAFEMAIKSLLLQLIVQIAQTDAFISLRPARHSDVCKEILNYIQNHYMEKIKVTDIAMTVGISPTYFSTFFVQHFYQHFSEYLCNYRIERACAMLANTSMTITDIALATGFSSGSHFIRHFRSKMGTTPFSYRKKHELIQN